MYRQQLTTTIYDDRRQCYFNGERYLRLFRMYTQHNCELECLANYTMAKCGCVKFSMPRDSATPVCGARSVTCYNTAEDDHLWLEFYDGLQLGDDKPPGYGDYVQDKDENENDDDERKRRTACHCLPSCTSIAYDAETSQADFDWENLFLAFRNPTDEFPG